MKKEKIIIKIKPNDLHLRNELHFDIQRKTRAHVFRNRKLYNRKVKHKKAEIYEIDD